MTDTTNPTQAPVRRLARPRAGRRLAGVAEGLGRHFNVDPTLARLGFVTASFLGGFGVVAYGLAWALIPDESTDDAVPQTNGVVARWATWLLAGIAALTVLDIAAYGYLGDGYAYLAAETMLILGCVGAITVAALVRPLRHAILLVGIAVVVAVAAATAAVADVSLRGGIGDREWTPVADVNSEYRLGIGDAELDLTATTDLAVDSVVTVGVGSLTVIVPANAVVDIDASTGVGRVDVLGRHRSGVHARRHVSLGSGTYNGVIRLELHTGVGDVEVIRA